MAAGSRRRRGRVAVLAIPDASRLRELSLARLLPSGTALAIGFAVLAGGAVAYFGARETAVFELRSIEVAGASPRVTAHVRAALLPLEGRSLLAVGSGVVRGRLAGLSDVAAVSYDRDFPHTLRVVVTPAHSIAVLRRGAAAWIVSSDGRVVRAAGAFSAPRLPRVWLSRAATVEVGTTLAEREGIRTVRALAAARGAGFGARLRAARFADGELTFVLPSGFEVRLGDGTGLALKLAIARRILLIVQRSGAYVDLSVPSLPVVGGSLDSEV